jgi:hypothetical protein
VDRRLSESPEGRGWDGVVCSKLSDHDATQACERFRVIAEDSTSHLQTRCPHKASTGCVLSSRPQDDSQQWLLVMHSRIKWLWNE